MSGKIKSHKKIFSSAPTSESRSSCIRTPQSVWYGKASTSYNHSSRYKNPWVQNSSTETTQISKSGIKW